MKSLRTAVDKPAARTLDEKKWDAFVSFLCPDDLSSSKELEGELKLYGINTARVAAAINAMIAPEPAWIKQAQQKQALFEQQVRRKRTWLSDRYRSAKELLSAISSGDLGVRVEQHAAVFFRDRDIQKASESDLRSFVNDCELLGILAEQQPRPEIGPKKEKK